MSEQAHLRRQRRPRGLATILGVSTESGLYGLYTLLTIFVLVTNLAACAGQVQGGTPPDAAIADLAPEPDLAAPADFALGDLTAVPTCNGKPCAAPKQCLYDTCLDPPGPCSADGDCRGDTYCEKNLCLPYGVGPRMGPNPTNPQCNRPLVIGFFQPATKCKWTGPAQGGFAPNHKNVLSTPLVVDFDFDGDPKTFKPSIVFNTYNCNDGSCGAEAGCSGIIRVIDGETCKDQYSFGGLPGSGAALLIGDTTPAIGDLDGDGRPDVVAERQGGGVVGFRFDAGQQKFVEMWPGSYSTFNAGGCHWSGPSLHDLDDDGIPEILQITPYPAAYDRMGRLIDGFTGFTTDYSAGMFPVAGDFNGDGQVEVVTGRETFRFDKAVRKWVTAWQGPNNPRGHTAVADFGTYGDDPARDDAAVRDGIPEIAVVASGTVRVQSLGGRIFFGPITLPGGGTGGPPTIADFDGDGRPEVGVAGASAYSVLDPDCRGVPDPKRCRSQRTDGVLWSKASQDQSSNVTGSSVFDFDGDGQAEVVYADECFSRVYDGATGTVYHSQPHTSCTWYENPIVADVNGDYKSEIVIPSNANCSVSCPGIDPVHDGVRCAADADCPGTTKCVMEAMGDKVGRCRCTIDTDCDNPTLACRDPASGPSPKGKVCRTLHLSNQPQQGIEVVRDVLDRWVNSRAIWNQHAYAVTNVDDNGKIPRTSQWRQNWKIVGMNNFRTNVQGTLKPLDAPDVTCALVTPLVCDQKKTLRVVARVCNRGTAPIAAGIPVTVYDGKVGLGKIACQTATKAPLAPGACEQVSCDYPNAPTSPFQLSIQADDQGGGKGTTTECLETNNSDSISGQLCNVIG